MSFLVGERYVTTVLVRSLKINQNVVIPRLHVLSTIVGHCWECGQNNSMNLILFIMINEFFLKKKKKNVHCVQLVLCLNALSVAADCLFVFCFFVFNSLIKENIFNSWERHGSSYGHIVGQNGSFKLGIAITLGEGKLISNLLNSV